MLYIYIYIDVCSVYNVFFICSTVCICTVLLHIKIDIIHTTCSNVAAVSVLVVIIVKFPGQIAARNIRNLRDYLPILQISCLVHSTSYVYALTT